MTWKSNDGQMRLRADIAKELEASGVPASQASQQATSELLKLRAAGPGEHEVHVGSTTIIVKVNE